MCRTPVRPSKHFKNYVKSWHISLERFNTLNVYKSRTTSPKLAGLSWWFSTLLLPAETVQSVCTTLAVIVWGCYVWHAQIGFSTYNATFLMTLQDILKEKKMYTYLTIIKYQAIQRVMKNLFSSKRRYGSHTNNLSLLMHLRTKSKNKVLAQRNNNVKTYLWLLATPIFSRYFHRNRYKQIQVLN